MRKRQAPFVWKKRCVGSVVVCWSLERVSSSRTTSAFPAELSVAVSLVTSCAFVLRWPANSFSSSSCQSAFPAHLLAGQLLFLIRSSNASLLQWESSLIFKAQSKSKTESSYCRL